MGVKKLNYHINPASWYSVFAVPCELVDKHLKLAGAVQLKVLLWALRHNDQPINDEAIATALHIQRADVSDAMLYWQECGLLIEQNEDEYIPTAPTSHLTAAPAESPAVPAAAPPAAPKPPVKLLSRPQKADNAFVARRMLESDEIRFLMEEAQQILGRLINNGESATLLMLHDDYGLPVDVIIMLIQYAVGIGKGNLRYIEKVAINWADEEIFTHEQAEAKLRLLDERQQAWHTVEQALSIERRSPTQREIEYANRWVTEWKFPAELLHEAYERCVDQTGKVNLRYINKILENWQQKGVRSLEQARQEQTEKAAQQPQKQVTYDIDSFEKSGVFDDLTWR